MNILAEHITDRRNLRKKISFWRVVTFIVLVTSLLVIGVFIRKDSVSGKQIARIPITGLIVSDQSFLDMIQKIEDNKLVEGVVLSIDSPGGTTAGSEDLFLALRRLSGKKPMVAFINGTGASGSYIAAMSADHIVARETAIVGSIGVIIQYPNIAKLLNTVGVDMESVKSAPLKAEPSGVAPTPPEAREALQNLIDDSFAWFKSLVSERRQLSDKEVAHVSDGRVFSGRQGLKLKLVDSLGNEKTAIQWLEDNKNVKKNLPVKEWKPDKNLEKWQALGFASKLVRMMGWETLAHTLDQVNATTDISRLDGILAVWHPTFTQ